MYKFKNTFDDLIKYSHELAVKKGFWPDNKKDRNKGELIALLHSEISEMLEADRAGKHCSEVEVVEALEIENEKEFKDFFQKNIKDTFEDETADEFIRLMDLVGAFNINILCHINAKLRFNETRGNKHGKNY